MTTVSYPSAINPAAHLPLYGGSHPYHQPSAPATPNISTIASNPMTPYIPPGGSYHQPHQYLQQPHPSDSSQLYRQHYNSGYGQYEGDYNRNARMQRLEQGGAGDFGPRVGAPYAPEEAASLNEPITVSVINSSNETVCWEVPCRLSETGYMLRSTLVKIAGRFVPFLYLNGRKIDLNLTLWESGIKARCILATGVGASVKARTLVSTRRPYSRSTASGRFDGDVSNEYSYDRYNGSYNGAGASLPRRSLSAPRDRRPSYVYRRDLPRGASTTDDIPHSRAVYSYRERQADLARERHEILSSQLSSPASRPRWNGGNIVRHDDGYYLPPRGRHIHEDEFDPYSPRRGGGPHRRLTSPYTGLTDDSFATQRPTNYDYNGGDRNYMYGREGPDSLAYPYRVAPYQRPYSTPQQFVRRIPTPTDGPTSNLDMYQASSSSYHDTYGPHTQSYYAPGPRWEASHSAYV